MSLFVLEWASESFCKLSMLWAVIYLVGRGLVAMGVVKSIGRD